MLNGISQDHSTPGLTQTSLFDGELLDALTDADIAVELRSDVDGDHIRFSLASTQPVPLRRMLPALQSMDLEVIQETTTTLGRGGGGYCHVYDLILQAGDDAAAELRRGRPDCETRIRDTFTAIWDERIDADGYNALVLTAGLNWQQVNILRSYGRYLRQLPLPYGQARIQRVLLDNPEATVALIQLHEARFGDPARPASDSRRQTETIAAEQALTTAIERVVHIDADRVLRAYQNLITATVRTNAYTPDVRNGTTTYLAHKLSARDIEELPEPRPVSEIIVFAPDFEGLHLRFDLVARGGLRWSDRHDDYRTEVLGLVKAQTVKNAVIVPGGAKGVFVVRPRRAEAPHRIEEHQRAVDCYQQFISALLDVVDHHADADDSTPTHTVRHDGPDSYLVVAADKGTAAFSDHANAIALRRGYWLGDAFASGGSTGYDHKAMGITARGAWVSADSHLSELGIDAHTDAFTVVGIGDMSGDVFGNGMLLRRGIRLVAAFDHRHVFIDPSPQTDIGYRERRRLFDLPRSSWADYDRSLISAGGGVWSRDTKAIALTPQIRDALGIADAATHLAPHELIQHVLRAPVDMLWNGGIGTYIKASTEQHSDAADKMNDAVRINATEVRARTVAEGGNLGVTARGRIEYAHLGGLINTDAIDNAAGVDCSDHEVNIKILLDIAVADGSLTESARNDLLVTMTDEVGALVLANNRSHNRLLSDARFNAAQTVDVHARMTSMLESQRGLHRERELLPSDAEYAELASAGAGLTGPHLATLMAHTKLDLKADLLADERFDDPYFGGVLSAYFPAALRETAGRHPLRRQILATTVVNQILATSGLSYAFRLSDETRATTGDIVRAHAIVSQVFALDELWSDIYAAQLPPSTTNALIIESRRLLDRASRWFLHHRPQPLNIGAEIDRFKEPVSALRATLSTLLQGSELATVTAAQTALIGAGTPTSVAQPIAESLYVYSLLDIVEAAQRHQQDAAELARIYFRLSAHLGVDNLLIAVSSLARTQRWHALARLALREDLYRSLCDLAVDVSSQVHQAGEPVDAIDEFESFNQPRLQRARRVLDEFLQLAEPDLAAVTVATTQLRMLVAARS